MVWYQGRGKEHTYSTKGCTLSDLEPLWDDQATHRLGSPEFDSFHDLVCTPQIVQYHTIP